MSYLQTVATHPAPRRGLGFVLVALFHGVMLVVIAKALNIPITIPTITQTDVTIIEHEKPKAPVPLPTIPNVTMQTWQTVIPQPEPVISDPTDTGESGPTIIARTEPIAGGATDTGPVIVQAKTDPRHPLTRPLYPAQSKRLGEHGTVELLLYILPNGKVQDARISRSSGFKRLDDAALQEALRAWRLLPMRENGVAVAGWGAIAITFRLTD